MKTRALAIALLACASLAGGATSAPEGERYYSIDDFALVDKIDAHMHIHGDASRFMAQVLRDQFRILTINVDYPDFPPIAEQLAAAVSLRQRYPGRVAFAGTFSVDDFNSPQWPQSALHQIDAAVRQGAVGIKVWKNIGMALKDPQGHYVLIDDRRFEPIWQDLERRHLVLLAHQAEPLNCWLPLDQMTVQSDREYFTAHPQYYMFKHPQMPSHDAILAARDRMLAAHPGLTMDAVHLASLEWDIDRVAQFLDRFPSATVDLAARMVHLEHQAIANPDKVRGFMIRYQDRILYGSDDSYGPADGDDHAVAQIDADWRADWEFLVTRDTMHSPDFKQPFRGLHLPREVIDKLYRRNAERLFSTGWNAGAPRV